jgi:hypothetical protein
MNKLEKEIALLEADMAQLNRNWYSLVKKYTERRDRDLLFILEDQNKFSLETFGPGMRTQGLIDHITKELVEVSKDPSDIMEYIDIAILAFDGAWRTGATPLEIVSAYKTKLAKNKLRQWPDWRTADPTKAIEHVRT